MGQVPASSVDIPLINEKTKAVTTANTNSRLLRLPQEIKNLIYGFVCGRKIVTPFSAFNSTNLSFMTTSRQIYHDSHYVPYVTSGFLFAHEALCSEFLESPSSSHHMIRLLSLNISYDAKIYERVWAENLGILTKHLRELRDLSIDVDIAGHGPWAGEGPFASWTYSEPLLFQNVCSRLPKLKKLKLELLSHDDNSWFNYIRVPHRDDPDWPGARKEELLAHRKVWIEAARSKLLGLNAQEVAKKDNFVLPI